MKKNNNTLKIKFKITNMAFKIKWLLKINQGLI